jgi:hypothetical protein
VPGCRVDHRRFYHADVHTHRASHRASCLMLLQVIENGDHYQHLPVRVTESAAAFGASEVPDLLAPLADSNIGPLHGIYRVSAAGPEWMEFY